MLTLTSSDTHAKLSDVLDKAVEESDSLTLRMAQEVVLISAEQFPVQQRVEFDVALGRARVDNRETLRALADK